MEKLFSFLCLFKFYDNLEVWQIGEWDHMLMNYHLEIKTRTDKNKK